MAGRGAGWGWGVWGGFKRDRVEESRERWGGAGGGHSHKLSEGQGGFLWVYKIGHCNGNHSKTSGSLSLSLPSNIVSQSILRNYFKVCTKFTLEGAE